MEQTVRIIRVRSIAHDKKGKRIDLTVIDLANGKPSIIRRKEQFLQDLKNSELIDINVTSLTHPQVREARKGLKRGMVSGDLTYNKKGEMWVVSAESSVLKADHPEFGKHKLGDKLPYQEDNTRVEGFLDLELNAQADQRNRNANALAMATLSLEGAFDDVFSDSGSAASSDDMDYDDIPDDVISDDVSEDAFGMDTEDATDKVEEETAPETKAEKATAKKQ